MKLLSIETSCDETSLAIIASSNGRKTKTLSHITNSQADLHAQYGGVFPAMAKREHTKNLLPLVFASLQEAGLLERRARPIELEQKTMKKIRAILEREPDLAELVIAIGQQYRTSKIDAIAVTYGPGLEIALWTGFNVARALSVLLDCTLVPVNHMEGHIYSSLFESDTIQPLTIPALAVLISGGHTELVLIQGEHKYQIIGQTLDDAIGECYDKSARLLGLPYPGGHLISELAEQRRAKSEKDSQIVLPRPMMHTKDFNFSFSGLKTAVLRAVQEEENNGKLKIAFKRELAYELEQAIAEVMATKVRRAIEHYSIKQLIVAGGVAANVHLRRQFTDLADSFGIPLHLPRADLSGDNALMIALAGLRRYQNNSHPKRITRVQGNLKLK